MDIDKAVREHPELRALVRSPALEWHGRWLADQLARQVEKDFLEADKGKERTDGDT